MRPDPKGELSASVSHFIENSKVKKKKKHSKVTQITFGCFEGGRKNLRESAPAFKCLKAYMGRCVKGLVWRLLWFISSWILFICCNFQHQTLVGLLPIRIL